MKKITENPTLLLLVALTLGIVLGLLNWPWLNNILNFIASAFTRLFQLLAVPTIFLAIVTTLASLGRQAQTSYIFRHALRYTLLTTFAAALVGLTLFLLCPFNTDAIGADMLPDREEFLAGSPLSGNDPLTNGGNSWLNSHILSIIPNNLLAPFIEGRVLSVLLIAAMVGLALSTPRLQERCKGLTSLIEQIQELVFQLIRALVKVLPVGIVAFSAQLVIQLQNEETANLLGRYLMVILLGNAIQFFVVLPLFLLARGLNPLRVFRAMTPAVLMALFTKSSAATLPVTMQSAEERLKAHPQVARFVLPICTTINMNGCAAFILVTSLFVMLNGGLLPAESASLIEKVGFYAQWVFIAVFAAVGNAGVPMGCYFLTLSLVSGIPGAPIALMGLVLPLYTVIDMIETAENVWSDSCVCAMTDHDLRADHVVED